MNGMAVSAPPILKTLKTKDMIAKTILQQIGGKRFTAMTGSRDFIDMGNGLRMSLAKNKTSANRLDIIYDEGADLYNMRFYRRTFSKKTFECKTCSKYKVWISRRIRVSKLHPCSISS